MAHTVTLRLENNASVIEVEAVHHLWMYCKKQSLISHIQSL